MNLNIYLFGSIIAYLVIYFVYNFFREKNYNKKIDNVITFIPVLLAAGLLIFSIRGNDSKSILLSIILFCVVAQRFILSVRKK